MKQFTNIPPKGTSDWLPDEYQIRKYIFDTWRKVCENFGYKEYLTPMVEYADLYRAKSGEDIGGKELTTFEDRGGRELAIRPEMTPSVTRMVSKFYESTPKPIRLFSIANFFRNEKPQKGRNREFWQLNFDIFGSTSTNADIEILVIALEIMLAFNPPVGSFTLNINNRRIIDFILNEFAKVTEEQRVAVVRILDKFEKLTREDFDLRLSQVGLNQEQIENLFIFMSSNSQEELVKAIPKVLENDGMKEVLEITGKLNEYGYSDWFKFTPNVIRGFDYYDGMVFEVSDNNPENKRSLFGGGRYNGLAGIFGGNPFPAVGCAPGDETTKIFLESWGLLENIKSKMQNEKFYVPVLDESLFDEAFAIANKLRKEGKIVETGLEVERLGKALDRANRESIDKVVILGTIEQSSGIYKIKDMKTGKEVEESL